MPQIKLTSEDGEDVEITVVGATAAEIDLAEVASYHGYDNPSDVTLKKNKSAKIKELEDRVDELES